MTKRLTHRHISFADACAFVSEHNRHHRPPVGHRFSIAAYEGEKLVGVVIVGRPVSRVLDPMTVAEITRLCTDGTKDACSFLYGRARAAAHALGFTKVITYTLPNEGGASLRAAGFEYHGQTSGGSWDTPSRPRTDKAPTGPKSRWAA